MRRHPDDPFDDLFRQLEAFVDDVMHGGGLAGPFDPAAHASTGTHVDVHEYDDRLAVIADLPGVAKEDIDVSSDGRVLAIRAANEDRQYDERVRLPGTVDPESATAKYNNGVLEVRFERTDRSSRIDVE